MNSFYIHPQKQITSFSKNSHTYQDYSFLQKQIAEYLIFLLSKKENISSNKENIVMDIGCGSGYIYNNFQKRYKQPTTFIGVDISKQMLELHPKNNNIQLHNMNMDLQEFNNLLDSYKFDYILSSSSLQWSQNLSKLLKLITFDNKFAFSIFTDNTFKDLYNFTQQHTFLPSTLSILKLLSTCNIKFNYEIKTYKIEFKSNMEMLEYIKRSGVSGEKKLSVSKIKNILNNYQHSELEFEVIFIIGESQ